MSDLFTTRYTKFWTAFAGFLGIVASSGLVDLDYLGLVNGAIAFLTAMGVVALPNTPPAGRASDPRMSEQG